MPSCPVHGQPMKQWPSGDYFCPKKTDGEWCDVVIKADGTQATKNAPRKAFPKPQPKANGVASGVATEFRCRAALDFASRIYSGTQDSHNALELARAIVRHWDVTWKEP